MHNNTNYQCKICWNKALTFGVDSIQLSFRIYHCVHPMHTNMFSIQMLLHFSQILPRGRDLCELLELLFLFACFGVCFFVVVKKKVWCSLVLFYIFGFLFILLHYNIILTSIIYLVLLFIIIIAIIIVNVIVCYYYYYIFFYCCITVYLTVIILLKKH